MGPALTKALVITCREFGPDEASSAGFLNRVVDDNSLEPTVLELAESIAAKPRIPVFSTKRHTNAVTANMVGIDRAWADADGLIGGLLDAECAQARMAYIKAKLG